MIDQDHKPGVKEANLVSRKLQLSGIQGQEAEALVAEIEQQFGVDRVAYDPDAGILAFSYDATHCNLDLVESILSKRGAGFATNWWNRTKRSYYRYVDQNIKDNAGYEPHCCNKVPRK